MGSIADGGDCPRDLVSYVTPTRSRTVLPPAHTRRRRHERSSNQIIDRNSITYLAREGATKTARRLGGTATA